jgi:hypothetical protein
MRKFLLPLMLAFFIVIAFLSFFNHYKSLTAQASFTDRIRSKDQDQKIGNLVDSTLVTETVIVIVTTNSDDLNGDTSSVAALNANPGPDGISLREAMEASNNTTGGESIEFSPAISGSVIMIGSEYDAPLPILTGGGLTLNGDIDLDGVPDITLDGSLGEPDTPFGSCLNIWSGNNTIQGMNIVGCVTTIQFAVPNFHDGSPTTLSGNKILSNTITSDNVVNIGPLGWLEANDTEKISNITWQDTTISGNTFNTANGICIYAGSGTSTNNRISGLKITNNVMTGGGGMVVLAGDANTSYHGLPPPLGYADHNALENVLISGNYLSDVTYKAISVVASNFGNQYNSVDHVQVISNTIDGAMVGIILNTTGSCESTCDRGTDHNSMQGVEVRGNSINDIYFGILVFTAGTMFVEDNAPGAQDNLFDDLLIVHNQIRNVSDGGIWLFASVLRNNGGQISDNTLSNVVISYNDVLTVTKPYGDAIRLVGGMRTDYATSGSIINNRAENISLFGNRMEKSRVCLRITAGDGVGVTDNYLGGGMSRNFFLDCEVPIEIGANFNDAYENQLDWHLLFGSFLPMVMRKD